MGKAELVRYGMQGPGCRRAAADEFYRRAYDRAWRRGLIDGIPQDLRLDDAA